MEKGTIFTGKHFTGRVEVINTDEENNILQVQLTKIRNEGDGNPSFSTWDEDWNLQHVKWGFEQKEYFIKEFFDYPPTHHKN